MSDPKLKDEKKELEDHILSLITQPIEEYMIKYNLKELIISLLYNRYKEENKDKIYTGILIK